MADKYLLHVTAGPSYDPSMHTTVAVNGPNSTSIRSKHCTANVKVRIQNYRGLPHGSPKTSPYFSTPNHTHDQYSIAFTLVPHITVPGSALVFGNDFDHPIRDRIPPGFSSAFKIVKWAIDPGLDGDVYSDKPYLYGPLLSSINVLRVREKATKKGEGWEIPAHAHDEGIEEGGDGEGEKWREERGVPASEKERKKWALDAKNMEEWTWEEGRIYTGDFFNPYLDFNEFSLKLPGFSLSVLGYLDGSDSLRYVLKNKDSGDVFFVVVFTLVLKEDLGKEEAAKRSKAEDDQAEKREQSSKGQSETFEPKADDLD